MDITGFQGPPRRDNMTFLGDLESQPKPSSWEPKGPDPHNATWDPQEIAGLIFRDYENPLVSVNKALFLGGGGIGGVPLDCHDFIFILPRLHPG